MRPLTALVVAVLVWVPLVGAQTAVKAYSVAPDVALAAVWHPAMPMETPADLADGMAAYQITVDATGTIVRVDASFGDPKLQAMADSLVKTWHFTPLKDKSKTAQAWWSFVGLCYSCDWGFFACAPADTPPVSAGALPSRILVNGKAGGGKWEIAPLKEPRGPALQREGWVRQTRIQGKVVIDVTVGKDGKVTKIVPVSGHPLLLTDANDAARRWQFPPPIFAGHPVEALLRLEIMFTERD